jgi:thiamine-monophosphate kinase
VRRLRDLGEHAWIVRLLRRLDAGRVPGNVRVGPGDDAAVVAPGRRPLLLTIDALREGVHFRSRWTTPRALGRRAFRVNASDVAAMGGRPTVALLALEAPPRMPVADLDGLVAGFVADARRHGARLVGGNLSAGPGLSITVTLLGRAGGRIVTRAGARPGDGVWVTGALGASGLAVRRLRAGGRGRLPDPPDRIGAGERLAAVASAMIDVSDGLVQDAGHVARASGVVIEIDLARIPVAAACARRLGARAPHLAAVAGEDYELLVTVPHRRERALTRLRAHLGCRLTRVGRVVAGAPAVRVLDAAGRRVRISRAGYDHFR